MNTFWLPRFLGYGWRVRPLGLPDVHDGEWLVADVLYDHFLARECISGKPRGDVQRSAAERVARAHADDLRNVFGPVSWSVWGGAATKSASSHELTLVRSIVR